MTKCIKILYIYITGSRPSAFAKLKRVFSGKKKQHQVDKPKTAVKRKTIKIPKADANVMALTLGNLARELPLATGEPHFCGGCQATISCLSHVVEQEDKTLWTW